MSSDLPNSSMISFVAPGTQTSQSKMSLMELFEALTKCPKVLICQQQFEEICQNDLAIDVKSLNKQLLGILGEALLYYMTTWPGWKRKPAYSSGHLHFTDWFSTFQKYLIVKGTLIARSAITHFQKAKLVTEEAKRAARNDGATAPYSLLVRGPPSTLSNIIFVEDDGNIVLKQLPMKRWPQLTLKELLNWPHVSVEVKLPDISLTRSSTPTVRRYISLNENAPRVPRVSNIAHITKLPGASASDLQPYSYQFISSYLQQLTQTLGRISGLAPARLEELAVIFNEYLADIQEANVYNTTMCTNISVGYHIGECKYVRPRRTKNNHPKNWQENWLVFTEIIIPQVDFALNHFSAVQDLADTKDVTFESLNKLEGNSNVEELELFRLTVNELCVIYSCTFCSQLFTGPYAQAFLIDHFKLSHKGERPVICPKCQKKFEVEALVSQRWTHQCC